VAESEQNVDKMRGTKDTDQKGFTKDRKQGEPMEWECETQEAMDEMAESIFQVTVLLYICYPIQRVRTAH
jgi:hypothetical protein